MGDAAGELADALQPLRLREALLELRPLALGAAAVGEVVGDRADRGDPAVGVEQRELHDEQLLLLAVVAGGGQRELRLARLAGADDLALEVVVGAVDPLGRQRLEGRAPEDRVGLDADRLLVAAVDEQEALAGVLDGDERGRVVDDRLQALLAGALLGLRAAALAEVDELDEEVQRPLAVAVHERHVREQVQDAPVGVHHALLDRVAAPAAREQLADQRLVEVHVLGMAERREGRRAQVGLGAARHLRERAIQAQPATLEVDERHADRRVVERAAEELLGRAQRVLDAAGLGDVLAGAVHRDGRAAGVDGDLAARVHEAHVAVRAQDAVVDAPGGAVGDGRLDRPRDPGAVVGMDALQMPRPALRLVLGAQPVDPVELVGPGHPVGVDDPLPAPEPRDLLRLGELRLVGGERVLRRDARGDVEELDEIVERRAGVVAHERAADDRDHRVAVRGAQAGLELEGSGGAVGERLGDPAAAVVGAVGELERAERQQLLLAVPDEPAERVVDPAEAPVRPDDRHARRGVAEGLAEPLGVGGVAAGDVAGDDVAEPGVVVDDGADLRPADLAAGADDAQAQLLVAQAPVGAHLLEDRPHVGDVLGVDDVPEPTRDRGVRVAEQQQRGGGVGALDRAVHAADDERVGGELEQALLERVLGDVRKVVHRWGRRPLEWGVRGYVSADSPTTVERLRPACPGAGRRGGRAERRGRLCAPVRALAFGRSSVTVDVPEQPAPSGAQRSAPISAHFVNNVLAAAASYIDEDPDYARDVLAELGQFLSYRLREDPAPVGAAQELAHSATFLRLQQARFPDRITVTLPDAADVRGRVTPGTIQEPMGELLGRRLRGEAGALAVTLRPDGDGLELVVSGAGPDDVLHIPLTEVTT